MWRNLHSFGSCENASVCASCRLPAANNLFFNIFWNISVKIYCFAVDLIIFASRIH